MKKVTKQVIFYGAIIGLWALLAALKIWPPYVFPTPRGVADALVAGFQDHSFWIAIAVSMKRMLLGYGISVVLGMVLGLGVASNKFLEETWADCWSACRVFPAFAGCRWRSCGLG
jgi:NitT/TauT family transport system permease protein